jgi:hypothetical protein
LTALFEATKEKCLFVDDIIRHLMLATKSISRCFPCIEQCDMNTWSVKPFTVEDKAFEDKDIKPKENSHIWEKLTH